MDDKRTDFSLCDLAVYVLIFYFSKFIQDSKLAKIFPEKRVFDFLAFKACEDDKYNKIRSTAYRFFGFVITCFFVLLGFTS